MVLRIADENSDRKISKAEVVHAARAWYFYLQLGERFRHDLPAHCKAFDANGLKIQKSYTQTMAAGAWDDSGWVTSAWDEATWWEEEGWDEDDWEDDGSGQWGSDW